MYWNKELFSIASSEEALHDKLERLITSRENNSFHNHVFPSKKGSDGTVRGELSKDEFTLWRTNRTWNGIFYPIFKGRLISINEIPLLQISIRFNPLAELIVLLFTVGLIYTITTEIIALIGTS